MNYKENGSPPKAFYNEEFLKSSEARSIRILSEFYEPKHRFEKLNIVDTIVFFGSARLISRKEALKNLSRIKKETFSSESRRNKELKVAEQLLNMSKFYEDTVELSRRLTAWSLKLPTNENRFTICSGGGPGIMEAANKGASLAKGPSIGLNISIPFEQFVNKYVKPDLAFEFHYFFARKFWFAYLAKALVVFPGGFGTLDELMELLTLVQTGKIKKEMKIIVYGRDYWTSIINFEKLIEYGMISKSDMKLFDFCDNVDEVFEKITAHFRKYYLNNHKNGKGRKLKSPFERGF